MEEIKYTTEVIEDEATGELLIEIPQHVMNQMGWDYGTDLEWITENGAVILKEKKEE
jgi:antitoxin component of MazEF toxin-antitoxin module